MTETRTRFGLILKRMYHTVEPIPLIGWLARVSLGLVRRLRQPSLSERMEYLKEEFGTRLDQLPRPQVIISYAGLPDSQDHSLDKLYLAFENVFRGPRELIKERQRKYLPYMIEAGAGHEDWPVLDLGCGRGEWLELLKENNLSAIGLDTNQSMVSECLQLGLAVEEEDALVFLMNSETNSFGAVTGFHIVEHLPFRVLVQLLAECLRVVRPEGIGIFETPNPENILVGANSFYFDPTHLRPIPSKALRFWLEAVGWKLCEVVYLNPSDIACGPMDYAIIAKKVSDRTLITGRDGLEKLDNDISGRAALSKGKRKEQHRCQRDPVGTTERHSRQRRRWKPSMNNRRLPNWQSVFRCIQTR